MIWGKPGRYRLGKGSASGQGTIQRTDMVCQLPSLDVRD